MNQLNRHQKNADLTAEQIAARLHEVGWSLHKLAKHHGIHRSTLNTALYSPAPRCETRIAEALGVHPMTIWPTRYDASGNPNRRMGRPVRAPVSIPRVIPNLKNHHSTAHSGGKVQARGAV